jgi:apolipoprotein N-acyltransferase
LGALPVQLYEHQWVMDVSGFGYFPMAVLMALVTGGFVWTAGLIARKWPRVPLTLIAPLAWTAWEVLRGEVIVTGYPWLLIAHPLIDAPYVPVAASFLGTYFVGFLVVIVSAAIVEGAAMRRFIHGADGVAFVLACLVGAHALAPKEKPGPAMQIAIVQTNIPQSNKIGWEFVQKVKDFHRFVELTEHATKGSPDLIVWPETMFPGLTLSEGGVLVERSGLLAFDVEQFYDPLLALSSQLRVPMLIGALGYDGLKIIPEGHDRVRFEQKARYNSVFLVADGKVDPIPYSKLELTPFGEIMPYVNHWAWLQEKILAVGANGMAFDLSPGPGPRVFSIKGKKAEASIVTPICFEATKPALCRRLVRAAGTGPVIIVNLTNDGWFGSFRAGRLQHLQIARWRCAELGVPMVRAANTGISAAIDDRGRLLSTGVDGSPGAWDADGVLSASITPAAAGTLYARIGDVFGWIVLAAAAALTIAACPWKRRST